ncbi:MAG: hypothetical protein ABJA98_21520 [Acidobacteriota bacterium]
MDRPHSDNNGDAEHDPPPGSGEEAPTTPTDEPLPMPIQDPPENPTPVPLTVAWRRGSRRVGLRLATVH